MTEQAKRQSPDRARIDRARIDRIFGTVLPETTDDERDPSGAPQSGAAREAASDEWLRRNVPPHHG